MSNVFQSYAFLSNPYASNAFRGIATPAPGSHGKSRRRFGSTPISGRGGFGGGLPKKSVCPDGTRSDPSFVQTAVDLLCVGKDHERRSKTQTSPDRQTIYDLRLRLAKVKEEIERLEAEGRQLVEASQQQRALHEAQVQELLCRMAALEEEFVASERERVLLEGQVLESEREVGSLAVALQAEQAARTRSAILVGGALGLAALTWGAVPAKYAWVGYAGAGALGLWGLLELMLPAR